MRELFSEGGAPFSAKLLRSFRRRPGERDGGIEEEGKGGARRPPRDAIYPTFFVIACHLAHKNYVAILVRRMLY
ncbi:hypothetical protein PUN28_010953 [Cardiocondyla obscurior]|uniref:Uncharacterized protein n=1 Tax=Cardiocondyla obscurior TaxID=286306 RepID=A0AAW2FKK7_9HYME